MRLTAGFGTNSKHGYFSIAPQVGFDLNLGSVFTWEVRFGPAALLQVGEYTVAGFAIAVTEGFAFRLWDDDRRRLKLVAIFNSGGMFGDDSRYLEPNPHHATGVHSEMLGVLAFETPF